MSKDSVANITKEQLCSLIAEGKNVKEICEILNIGHTTYNNLLKRFEIATSNKISKEITQNITKELLQEKLDTGKEPKEIAQELGISTATCINHMEKYGLTSTHMRITRNVASITKEQLKNLINSGKTKKEICKILNIGDSTYSRLLNRFEIVTSQKESLQKNANITKEQLQAVVDKDLPLIEACKELGISKSAYNVLLTKFGIKTKTMLNKERLDAITEEQFRSLLDAGLTAAEIQKELNISTKFYYTLMRKFNIEVKKYDVKGNDDDLNKNIGKLFLEGYSIKEIAEKVNISEDMCRRLLKNQGHVMQPTVLQNKKKQITKEQVLEVLAKGQTTKENYEELGLTESSYYSLLSKYGIQTNAQKQRSEIAALTISNVKDLLSANKSLPEICDELNISESTFYNILAKHNVKTPKQTSSMHNKTITKEKFVDLVNQGKTANEICAELKIKPSRYIRLKFIYELSTPTNGKIKNFEYCSVDELKEKMIDLFIENEHISQNNTLLSIIDFINANYNYTEANKFELVKFTRLIEYAAKNKITMNELTSNQLTQKFIKEMQIKESEETKKQEQYEIKLAQFIGIIQNFEQNNLSNVATICYKYIPQSINDPKTQIMESIIEMIKKEMVDENESIQQLNKIKRNIIYLDATLDTTAAKELEEAKEFCKKHYNSQDPEKIGQIIDNNRIYNNYLNTGTTNDYPVDFVELVKEKSALFSPKYQKDKILLYLIKLDNWFNSEMSEKNYINDFLQIFSTDRLIDNAIIQHFIETIYTQQDTSAVAISPNGRCQKTSMTAKAKNKIYLYRNKYPNSLEYLCAFEEALQKFAPPKGSTGIKIETTGQKRIKLKVSGIPDRIFSTNRDYCFDDYSPTGDH